jgi:hypothetical protein
LNRYAVFFFPSRDPDGTSITYVHHAVGAVLQTTAALRGVTRAVFDLDGEAVASRDPLGRRVSEGFRLILRENLPPAADEVIRFRVALDEAGRIELDWQQPDPFSALATFHFAGQPAFTCLLLSGYDARHDAVAVGETRALLRAWGVGSPAEPQDSLESVRERPLLACIPWPVPVEEADRRRVARWSVCLALAFFERAGAAGPAAPECN